MKDKMIKAGLAGMAVIAAMAMSNATEAADATVGADLASAYVFRGGTLNDSAVLQPYVEVGGEGLMGFTIGTWANFDLDDNEGGSPEGGHFSEIDLYASYDIPMAEDSPVGLSVGYTEYTYPRAGGTADPATGAVTPVDADREVSVSASLDAPLAPSVGVFYGVDGGIDGNFYVEAGLGHDLELSEDMAISLGGTLGYLDPDVGESGFSFASLSASTGVGPLSVGVTYIIETDDKVLVVDEDFVATVGIGGEF